MALVHLGFLRLGSRDKSGHQSLAWFLVWIGRLGEARAEFEKMRALDPAYPTLPLDESSVYYHQRDYKSLVEAGQKAVVASPGVWTAHYFLAVGYQGSGRLPQAIPEYHKAVELSQCDSDPNAGLAHALATVGRKADAQKMLDEFRRESKYSYVSPYMIAVYTQGWAKRTGLRISGRGLQREISRYPVFYKSRPAVGHPPLRPPLPRSPTTRRTIAVRTTYSCLHTHVLPISFLHGRRIWMYTARARFGSDGLWRRPTCKSLAGQTGAFLGRIFFNRQCPDLDPRPVADRLLRFRPIHQLSVNLLVQKRTIAKVLITSDCPDVFRYTLTCPPSGPFQPYCRTSG
jgi:hypothetical protein